MDKSDCCCGPEGWLAGLIFVVAVRRHGALEWRQEDTSMKNNLFLTLALMVAGATFSGCVPVLIGAAGAVAVDEVLEQKQGGDGLF